MLLDQVRDFIRQHQLLHLGQSLIVGVSGGPDSLVLLHLLVRLREEYRLELRAAHLDHTLRPDSAADAQFVTRTAGTWGVPCVVERADVAALSREKKQSVEEAGRAARYDFFARLGDTVAIAHHADDQAETVLMHFLRGAGLAGLRGMLPISQMMIGGRLLTVVRPLLALPRADIEAYVAAHGLHPRLDPSNADWTYFRNRLRHDLLPHLEAFNPNIRRVLQRTADTVAADYALVEQAIDEAWARVRQSDSGTAITFDLVQWRLLPLALRRGLLRKAVRHLKPDYRDLDYEPIQHGIDWAQTAQSGRSADLLAGLCLKITGDRLVVAGRQSGGQADLTPVPLEIGGRCVLGDWVIEATLLEGYSPAAIANNQDRYRAFIDAAGAPLKVRARKRGDRFAPAGMGGRSLKLSDYMINRKIPVEVRARLPLVVSARTDEVLWVCGYQHSHAAQVTHDKRQLIQLTASPVTNMETNTPSSR